MSWRERLGRWTGGHRWDGMHGRPPSGNGASSFHLFWELAPAAAADHLVAAEVTLVIDAAPPFDDLVFWALQGTFTDGSGRDLGGAHLGLQWFAPHPGHTAVNWGGYGPDGRELAGSASPLPSAPGNPNTRDLAWRPGVPYRLRIRRGVQADPEGWPWIGEVEDVERGHTTVVRHLWSAGDRLRGPMVWSEVFAPCDAAGVTVRWRSPEVVGLGGTRHAVTHCQVNYQALGDGGCATTSSTVEGPDLVQRTGVLRTTAQGAVLRLGG